jgi:hypothetical protein
MTQAHVCHMNTFIDNHTTKTRKLKTTFSVLQLILWYGQANLFAMLFSWLFELISAWWDWQGIFWQPQKTIARWKLRIKKICPTISQNDLFGWFLIRQIQHNDLQLLGKCVGRNYPESESIGHPTAGKYYWWCPFASGTPSVQVEQILILSDAAQLKESTIIHLNRPICRIW